MQTKIETMSQLKYEFDNFKVEINHDIISYTIGNETILLPARFEVHKSDLPLGALVIYTVSPMADKIKFEFESQAKQREMFLMLGRCFGVGLDKKIEEEKIRLALNDATVWQNLMTPDEAKEVSAHTARLNVIERIMDKHKLKTPANPT